ncbi:Serine/threonine-protein kinase plo1 [Choanephora cucurbitarum]|uniref:Serine/threonine-protein kinase n=1 Tax=Choanephora cucurbitarum TaxID=101091 RepID=A0A1C7NQD8_9FUNG|nr:Serine/threonine-protein kinase plo1 [Choanephora cucurbitarum]
MSSQQRSRVQSLNSRAESQQRRSDDGPGLSANQLGKLEVIIPKHLSKQMSPKVDAGLKPLQTNKKPLRAQRPQLQEILNYYTEEPLKENAPEKEKKKPRPEYHLVEEHNVPTVIRDYKRKRQYKKLECLGQGAFAKVYRVATMEGQFMAAKVISKSSLLDQRLRNKILAEINIHRSLKHDNIVKFYHCIEDKNNIYLLLELCQNKTLSQMVRNRGGLLTELEVRYYMGQIFTVLRYLSDNRILHRDLKMSNVLLDANMDCKIGDFGLAALMLNKEDRKKTVCGTPHYIAPEILFSQGHDHRADIWSAGILMFNLLCGKRPFHHQETKKLYQQVRDNEIKAQFNFPSKEYDISDYAKNLITKLLVNNPDQRLSVIEALKHPFFQKPIPDKIPQSAFFRPPEYKELFEPSEDAYLTQSKVAMAIHRARDENECYVDCDIQPPLTLMDHTMYDPRSQYPMPHDVASQGSLVIPSTVASKKRAASIKSHTNNDNQSLPDLNPEITPSSSKRLCSHSKSTPTKSLQQQDKEDKEDAKKKPDEDLFKAFSSLSSFTDQTKDKHTPFAVPTALPSRKPMMEEMADNLKVMIHRTSSGQQQRRNENPKQDKEFQWNHHNVFLQTWVDFSSSYGFAYRLSDSTYGCLFNDGSTLTTIDEKAEDNRYVEQEYTTIPAELKKKCHILKQFRIYEGPELVHRQVAPKATKCTKIHLFKYFVTDNAIAFRLNNGVLQVRIS